MVSGIDWGCLRMYSLKIRRDYCATNFEDNLAVSF
jgi:hypothetical protein